MSRPGISSEATEIVDKITEKLGQDQSLSRTGIRRMLRGFLARNGLASAQEGAKSGT